MAGACAGRSRLRVTGKPSGAGGTSFGDVSVSVTESIVQNLAHNTWAALTFDTEEYDTAGMWAIGDPTKIVVPSTGKYLFGGFCMFTASNVGKRGLYFLVDGATIYKPVTLAATSAGVMCMQHTWPIPMVAGHYVELWAYQTSGGGLNTGGLAAYLNSFCAIRVA